MTDNPFFNALAAVAYIVALATLFFTLGQFMPTDPHPVIAGTLFLSVLVFSVALMGYFIVLAPLRLFIEGKKQEAVTLFLKTLLAFAGIAIVVFIAGAYLVPAPPVID